MQTPAEDRPYRSVQIPSGPQSGTGSAAPAAPAAPSLPPAAASAPAEAPARPSVLPPELSVRPSPANRGDVSASRPAVSGSAAPGLTAAGVLVVVGAVSLVAMLVDTFTGGGVGWLFGLLFILASTYAALQVRRQDLVWAVIVPPLVFAVLVCVHAMFTTTGDALTKIVAAMNALLDFGPMLWIGTGIAAAVASWRRWGGRFRNAARS